MNPSLIWKAYSNLYAISTSWATTLQITTSGTHQVLAQVMVGSEQVTTEPQSFELTLQAPAPVFLGVPAEITRTYSSSANTGGNDSGCRPFTISTGHQYPGYLP